MAKLSLEVNHFALYIDLYIIAEYNKKIKPLKRKGYKNNGYDGYKLWKRRCIA